MSHSITSRLPHVARILLGLGFFVFGLNGFLNFMPTPPMQGEAGNFIGALAATGYMFPFIKGTEVAVGALLLGNRFVPLALTVLAPIMLNIVVFHAVLAPAGIAMTLMLLVLHLYLAWSYRDAFRGVLNAEASPATPHAASPAVTHGAAVGA